MNAVRAKRGVAVSARAKSAKKSAIHVLSVASECAPLVKTGGLADVVGALPGALVSEGVEMTTLLPGYPAVLQSVEWGDVIAEKDNLFGGAAQVQRATAAGLDLLILRAPHLYEREGAIYLNAAGEDWSDNPERFAALSWMAAHLAADGVVAVDALHCHDWQAGLAPLYLRDMARNGSERAGRIGSILTIHNIAFQGLAPAAQREALGLPEWAFHQGGMEYWGQISALKAGLIYADQITTVSPTYAVELTTPAFGMGLDGVIRDRAADLSGILNGIDAGTWDPVHDREIHPYTTPAGKAANKTALRTEFGLPDADGPLAIVISRLSDQKGLDLLIDALPGFLARGGQLALLGSGDRALEAAFTKLAFEQPNVGVRIGYDEALSHRMMAGADAILVPSRFEPCGLTQLYGLRYGTLPLVALTGGLADTVISANDAALRRGVATGWQFAPIDAPALAAALDRMATLYAAPAIWEKMQTNAMAHPVGWAGSAAEYAALYRSVIPTE